MECLQTVLTLLWIKFKAQREISDSDNNTVPQEESHRQQSKQIQLHYDIIHFKKLFTFLPKDSKFVEARRVMLQNYLRTVVNKISQTDPDLNQKPCREVLCKTIPFLNDQLNCSHRSFHSRTNSNASQGNILNHMIRTNTTMATSNFLNGNEIMANVPIINNSQSQRANEPLYTGL